MNFSVLVSGQPELNEAIKMLSAIKVPAGCAACIVEFIDGEIKIVPEYHAPPVREEPRKSNSHSCKNGVDHYLRPVNRKLLEDHR